MPVDLDNGTANALFVRSKRHSSLLTLDQHSALHIIAMLNIRKGLQLTTLYILRRVAQYMSLKGGKHAGHDEQRRKAHKSEDQSTHPHHPKSLVG